MEIMGALILFGVVYLGVKYLKNTDPLGGDDTKFS